MWKAKIVGQAILIVTSKEVRAESSSEPYSTEEDWNLLNCLHYNMGLLPTVIGVASGVFVRAYANALNKQRLLLGMNYNHCMKMFQNLSITSFLVSMYWFDLLFII
jgi:hypothetical protein